MKNRNQRILLGILVAAAILVTGCGDNTNKDTQTQTENGVDTSNTEEKIYTYDKNTAKKIELDKESVNINEAGTYIVSGTLQEGQVIIDVPQEEVKLVLDNVKISSAIGSPIHVKNAKKVIVIPDASTVNSVEELAEGGSEAKSAIFSETDIVIAGPGELKVTSKSGIGIKGIKNVEVGIGRYNIEAGTLGISSDQNLTINGGEFEVYTDNDGIHAMDTVILGGTKVKIDTKHNGVVGNKGVNISGSDVYIDCENNSVHTLGVAEVGGTKFIGNSKNNIIYAEGNLTISGGELTLDSDKDNINCLGDVNISGSNMEAYSRLGAINTSKTVSINGGSLNINNAEYGIQAKSITMNGNDSNITTTKESIIAKGAGKALAITGSELVLTSEGVAISCKADANIAGSTVTIGDGADGLTPEEKVKIDGTVELVSSDIKDSKENKLDIQSLK